MDRDTAIEIKDVSKSYKSVKALRDISFNIRKGELFGLIGPDGAGKTTLFRILTGELDYDSGEVTIASGKRLGLISQIPVYPPEYTVEEVLRTAFARTKTMQEEMDALAEQMAAGDHSQQTLRRYGDLNARFEGLGGWDTDTAVNKVAGGLSMDEAMRARPFAELSGGEKTRVNLGRLILEDTDILLLDEPTNHLDLQATIWLEEYIGGFGARSSPYPMTDIFWTAPLHGSLRFWTARRSFTAGITASTPWKRSGGIRSA